MGTWRPAGRDVGTSRPTDLQTTFVLMTGVFNSDGRGTAWWDHWTRGVNNDMLMDGVGLLPLKFGDLMLRDCLKELTFLKDLTLFRNFCLKLAVIESSIALSILNSAPGMMYYVIYSSTH